MATHDFLSLVAKHFPGASVPTEDLPGRFPGTTKLHRLEENIGAAAVELSAEDLGTIHEAVSKIAVQGARYPERMQQLVGR